MGSQMIWDGNWTSILSEFTCRLEPWLLLVSILLLVAILPWCKLGRNSLRLLCTGGTIVVVGWRK
jgi:hypothetical protein